MASVRKSRYPVHFAAANVKSTSTIMVQAFSVPKGVRLVRLLEKSYGEIYLTERIKDELEPIVGEKFMGYASRIFSDFEKQKQNGSTARDCNAVNDSNKIHRVMMEMLPCNYFLQRWCYPGLSNQVLIWDSDKTASAELGN